MVMVNISAAFVDGPASDHKPEVIGNGWIPALVGRKNADGSVSLFVPHNGRATDKCVSTYPSYYSNKPDRRYRWVMHNCFRYRLIWE